MACSSRWFPGSVGGDVGPAKRCWGTRDQPQWETITHSCQLPSQRSTREKNCVSEADLELEPEKRAADRMCGYHGVQNRSADTRGNKPAFPSPGLGSSQCLPWPTQQEARKNEGPGDLVCGDQAPVSPIQSAEKRGKGSRGAVGK